MTYVATVIINGVEEAGHITDLVDNEGRETTDIAKAVACVLRCSRGLITMDIDAAPIFTVH